MSALDANHHLADGWLCIPSSQDFEAGELFINVAHIVQVSADLDSRGKEEPGSTVIRCADGVRYGVEKSVQEVLMAIGAVKR